MTLFSWLVPELDHFASPAERYSGVRQACREAVRPSTFWSGGQLLACAFACAVFLTFDHFGPAPRVYFCVLGLLLGGVALYLALHAIARFRRVLRERLILSGRPLCLHCGYSLKGLEPFQRCPECGTDCRNLAVHAGTPLREAVAFPELLSFDVPGEARAALVRAFEDAGPFYSMRFMMLGLLVFVAAFLWFGLSYIPATRHGDPLIPVKLGIILFVVSLTAICIGWYRWVHAVVRESLAEQLRERTSPSPPTTPPVAH